VVDLPPILNNGFFPVVGDQVEELQKLRTAFRKSHFFVFFRFPVKLADARSAIIATLYTQRADGPTICFVGMILVDDDHVLISTRHEIKLKIDLFMRASLNRIYVVPFLTIQLNHQRSNENSQAEFFFLIHSTTPIKFFRSILRTWKTNMTDLTIKGLERNHLSRL
jgi:hypothetical protein